MKMRSKMVPRGSSLLALAAAVGLMACDDAPTTAVVQNGFPATPALAVTVYRAWWITTLFPDTVGPDGSSTVERTVPGSDYAYALLAPGWTPDQGQPARLIAVKSAAKLQVSAHDVLHIVIDDTTFVGDCAAGEPLDADDARLIVERLFPGPFAGATYDPATCTTTAAGAAGGSAGADGTAGAGGIGGG